MKKPDDLRERQVDVIDKLRNRVARLRQGIGERTFPIITLTYAQSLDACIATFEGGTLQLSNPKTQQMTHQIRAVHDAILVGINTVICDNPRLTVRLATGKNPQPIVLDSKLRMPLDANLMKDPCVRPIIAAGHGACEKKANQLIAAGARLIRVPQQENGLIDLLQLLPVTKQMGINTIMVEGGSKVITSFLTSQIADQLLVAIAPRFVGGLRAVNPTKGWEHIPHLQDVHCQLMDGDLVVWGHFENANRLHRASSSRTGVLNALPECSPSATTEGELAYDDD